MSESASISTGIANRYATAIFDIASESDTIDGLASDVDTLGAALDESDDFATLISSPIYSRDEQSAAVSAIADKMGLSATTGNALRLMASKRRLFVLPQLLARLREKIADARGEVTADVTAASALTDEQKTKLAAVLKDKVGKDVNINATVDESLIGGLIVKVGSRMIDTSIRAKLDQLQNIMKEAR